MQVLLVAPFLVPGAVPLAHVLDEDPPAAQREGLLIDKHRSRAQQVPSQCVRHRARMEGSDTEVVLRTSDLGIGSAAVWVDVPDREALHRRETAIRPLLQEVVSQFCSSAADPSEHDTGARGLPVGVILWFHRVVLLAGEDKPRAIRLFGEDFRVTESVGGTVADGFTTIDCEPGEHTDDVLEGLLNATEEWLLIDDFSRRLGRRLVIGAKAPTDEDNLRCARALVRDAALAALVLDERRRHAANSVLRVHLAAARCWRIDEARDMLVRRSESVLELLRLESEHASAVADERRNGLLFGFTAVTVLQSVLLIADFAGGQPLDLLSRLRFSLAGLILVATVAIVAYYAWPRRAAATG